MAGFEAGGGSGAGVGALGPLQALWRDVYAKAGAAAEARAGDLVHRHVYDYHPVLYAGVGHAHPSPIVGLWKFSPDSEVGDPGSGYFRSDTGSLLDATVLVFSRTTAENQPYPGLARNLRPGDRVYAQAAADVPRQARYAVTAAAEWFEEYLTVPVAVLAAGAEDPLEEAPCWGVFLLGGGAAIPTGGSGVVAQVSDSGDVLISLVDNAHTPIPFDRTDFDPYGFRLGTTDPTVLTVPEGGAGWYRFTAAVPTDLNVAPDIEDFPTKEWEVYVRADGYVLGGLSGTLTYSISLHILYASPAYWLEEFTDVQLVLWHNQGYDGDIESSDRSEARLLIERVADGPPPDVGRARGRRA